MSAYWEGGGKTVPIPPGFYVIASDDAPLRLTNIDGLQSFSGTLRLTDLGKDDVLIEVNFVNDSDVPTGTASARDVLTAFMGKYFSDVSVTVEMVSVGSQQAAVTRYSGKTKIGQLGLVLLVVAAQQTDHQFGIVMLAHHPSKPDPAYTRIVHELAVSAFA